MNCALCDEVITNPLCPCCLHEEVRQWLLEEGHERLAAALDAITSSLVKGGQTRCLMCSGPMGVCAYCYTRDVLELVRHDKRLLERNIEYFNFDLGHLGWEREARAYLDE